MTSSQYDAVRLNTDNNTYTVTQATLVLQAVSGGAGSLSIWDATDGGQPTDNLGTFSGPASLTSTLSDNVFTDAGIVLQPNTEYWLVFQVTAGTVNWGIDDFGASGTGALFDGSYSEGTIGAGYHNLIFTPTQTELLGTVTPASSVPEPATLGLALAGVAAGWCARRCLVARPRTSGS